MKHSQNEWQLIEEQHEKLLDAAPDLLENLIRLVDRIKENDLQHYFPSAFNRAEAAIKKATL